MPDHASRLRQPWARAGVCRQCQPRLGRAWFDSRVLTFVSHARPPHAHTPFDSDLQYRETRNVLEFVQRACTIPLAKVHVCKGSLNASAIIGRVLRLFGAVGWCGRVRVMRSVRIARVAVCAGRRRGPHRRLERHADGAGLRSHGRRPVRSRVSRIIWSSGSGLHAERAWGGVAA